jgi:hypothetical protein
VFHESPFVERLEVLERTLVWFGYSLRPFDRLVWTILRRLWSAWAGTLIIVESETVVRWHRAGFRLYWRCRSRAGGRPKITLEIGAMISSTAEENPNWAFLRSTELLKLGFRPRKGPRLGTFDGFDGGETLPSGGSHS